MPCIRLATPEGHTRLVPEGKPYQLAPGETVAGVAMHCSDVIESVNENDSLVLLVSELDGALGKGGPGDWIKSFASPVAKLLGKKGCMSCEVRRIVTNAYANLRAKHGTAEALRIMKELWQQSLQQGSSEKEVLQRLQNYLN